MEVVVEGRGAGGIVSPSWQQQAEDVAAAGASSSLSSSSSPRWALSVTLLFSCAALRDD